MCERVCVKVYDKVEVVRVRVIRRRGGERGGVLIRCMGRHGADLVR